MVKNTDVKVKSIWTLLECVVTAGDLEIYKLEKRTWQWCVELMSRWDVKSGGLERDTVKPKHVFPPLGELPLTPVFISSVSWAYHCHSRSPHFFRIWDDKDNSPQLLIPKVILCHFFIILTSSSVNCFCCFFIIMIPIQAYLVLLHFTVLDFMDNAFLTSWSFGAMPCGQMMVSIFSSNTSFFN